MTRLMRAVAGALLGGAILFAPLSAGQNRTDGCPDGVVCDTLACTQDACCLINTTHSCICDCVRVE